MLVVGATVAGLASAAFLAHHGVSALVVDPRPRRPRAPRNHRLTTRTMELLHSAGFADPVRAIALDAAAPRAMATVETLAGTVLSLSEPSWPDVAACYCNDGELSDVLRSVAVRLGADVRMNTGLVRHDQDADGITSVLRDQLGAEHVVRSDFLLLADGSPDESSARTGIDVRGPGTLSRQVSIAFRADLDAVVPAAGGFVVRAVTGLVLPEPGPHRWALVVSREPGELTDGHCEALVRKAIGRSDVDVMIIGRTSFDVVSRTATRFTDGRLALLGDAACVAPPVPGMHGNTHIQEAHDLAGRIAAGLLDGYDRGAPSCEYS